MPKTRSYFPFSLVISPEFALPCPCDLFSESSTSLASGYSSNIGMKSSTIAETSPPAPVLLRLCSAAIFAGNASHSVNVAFSPRLAARLSHLCAST